MTPTLAISAEDRERAELSRANAHIARLEALNAAYVDALEMALRSGLPERVGNAIIYKVGTALAEDGRREAALDEPGDPARGE